MSPSFLIVRFSAIGDCVMAAYAATAIREAMPDANLTWAVETRCMAMLNRDALLNEVVDFPRDRWRKRRWSPGVWREQLSCFARLRTRRFDYGMDLQGHSKTAICLRIARPQKRIAAFATDSLARRLTPLAPGNPDGKHRVERMMDTARAFGEFAIPSRPMMPKPISVQELGLNRTRRLATISTGAGALIKQYPTSQWVEVAEGLIKGGLDVAFLGASSDPSIEVPGTTNLVGKFSLEQTMSAVAHSAIHLAADTGTGHMAAAFGVPFVSVFGPTDPKLYRPYSDLGTVLRASSNPAEVSAIQILEATERLLG
jgi:ADP-heptose:LPS heptosyltransferase